MRPRPAVSQAAAASCRGRRLRCSATQAASSARAMALRTCSALPRTAARPAMRSTPWTWVAGPRRHDLAGQQAGRACRARAMGACAQSD